MNSKIRSLKVNNFKTFDELNIEFDNYNVLIGANSSGKSSFINLFKFLRDLANYNLADAIAFSGGIKFLRNLEIGNKKDLFIEIDLELSEKAGIRFSPTVGLGLRFDKLKYSFALSFNKRGEGYKIAEDTITLEGPILKFPAKGEKTKITETISDNANIIIQKYGSKIDVMLSESLISNKIRPEDLYPSFITHEFNGTKNPIAPLLQNPYSLFPIPWGHFFSSMSFFDFDPKLPKKAIPISPHHTLDEDGKNLAGVLKHVLEKQGSKRQFFNIISDLLPFVEDFKSDNFSDKTIFFKMRESRCTNEYIPASLISDGTINITALIIALFFIEKTFTVIEEPERNIHPHLISKVTNLIKEAAIKKQIFITTHNPEFVKHSDLDSILLISRDKNGFSTISKPRLNNSLKIFLQNEMGLDDLFIQNLI